MSTHLLEAATRPLVERFARHLASLALPPGPAVVAVSGGADSLALLDLLALTGETHHRELVVAHVDHGIAAASGDVARRVEDMARSYGADFRVTRLALGPEAGETLARARRYAWLERVRCEIAAGVVLTAHHADDQAETVLMRVLEGSGPAGLAAMPSRRGTLVRPLLPFRHAALVAHLEERGIDWWEDPGNADPRHLRSFIRSSVLPLLRGRLPEVETRLVRVAAQAAADRAGWDAALGMMPGLDCRRESDGISVVAPSLAGYDSALAGALVRAAARRVGLAVGPIRTDRILALAAGGRSGSSLPLGGGWLAEVRFGRLHLVRPAAEVGPEPESLTLDAAAGERHWGRWLISWRREPAPARQPREGWSAWLALSATAAPGAAPFTVRPWRPGDRIRPLGGAGGRLVVRCLQDARVPRGRRAGWPVLEAEGKVLWVPGVCRSDGVVPPEGTEALRVDVVDLATG